ncbi:LysR family transcriptional regulator [Methylosinus sp. H3A]|uniref:LysR substrate-binding domain-containing protein n=1 Tax=Methylosinus sp. H3A TaxID=2785786 RepID=UPI0018C2544E|nr:LysR substrate-binding domain-containing protein [Methylosinus sp. H3A]MBG0807893.1 LysR family transcriptional regulator [Methylosinus sp. H3A]
MQNLNDLYYFAKVAEHGGFSAAARMLGMPKSTLSRRISVLEEQLGVRLIQRSGGRFALTEVGQKYVRHCAGMIAEAEAARQVVEETRIEPSGLLRVSCPIALAQSRVSGIISRFLLAHPRVVVQLIATNRPVDLIEEAIDVALRVRFPPLEDSVLVMRTLAKSAQIIVAQPALLERLGRPIAPMDLGRFDSMDLTRATARHVWELTDSDGRAVSVPFTPRFVTDDMVTLRRAAMDGVGIVQLPEYLVRDHLEQGFLEPALSDWTPRTGIIHAVFPSRRGLARTVRGFVDFLAEELKADSVVSCV